MSGAQTSTFPDQNKLLEANAQQLANYYAPEKNRLLIETAKQEAGQREMEVMSRIASGLMSLPEDQRANAYPGAVQYAQSLGFAKNAPPVYPGHDVTQRLAGMGIPAADQYKLAADRSAKRALFPDDAGTTGPGAPAESPVVSGDTQARAQAVHDGMVKRGWGDAAAWGFAANAVQESDALPNPKPGDGGRSHGVFQWNGDRLAAFQAKYGVLPGQATLDQQLDFANDELSGGEKPSADLIRNAQTPGEAAAIISRGYLRPADVAGEQVRRAGIASRLTQGLNTGGATAVRGVAARIPGAVDVAGPGAGGTTAEQPGNQGLMNRLSVFGGGGAEPPPVVPAAPVVAPAPITPTAPAPTPTLPELPVPVAPNIQANGFTSQQNARLRNLRDNPAVSADELRRTQDAYVTQNTAAGEKYQADVRAYRADVLARQEAARKADEDARKAEKAAKEAADLLADKAEDQRIERTLTTIGPKIRRGDPVTPEEADVYTLMWNKYRDGPIQPVPDGKGGTFMARVPREVPPNFPPPPGQTVTAGPKPIPGTEKQPDFAPATVVGGMLANGAGQRKLMTALSALEAYPEAVGLKANSPEWLLQRTDPEGVTLRSAISNVAGHEFHDLSGAAVSPSEASRLKYIPSEKDTAPALKTKLQQMLDTNRETMLQSYRTYGPENGGRKLPAVEEAILDSIPQAALDGIKAHPDKARDFDKKYGKGAAKLVLDNG